MRKMKFIAIMVLSLGMIIFGFSSCTTSEIDFTGGLSVTNTIPKTVTIVDISVYVHLNNQNGELVAFGHANSSGSYTTNLLYGNYYVSETITISNSGINSSTIQSQFVQIKGSGKTSTLNFKVQ